MSMIHDNMMVCCLSVHKENTPLQVREKAGQLIHHVYQQVRSVETSPVQVKS